MYDKTYSIKLNTEASLEVDGTPIASVRITGGNLDMLEDALICSPDQIDGPFYYFNLGIDASGKPIDLIVPQDRVSVWG